MIENYLAAEQAIIARLESQLEGVTVKTAADVDGMQEDAQKTPAVYVVYDGDVPGETAGNERAQIVKQRWLAIVTVRNRRQIRAGSKTRENAGPILSSVIGALSGWKPDPGPFGEMQRIGALSPDYSAGFGYFPLAFELPVVTF